MGSASVQGLVVLVVAQGRKVVTTGLEVHHLRGSPEQSPRLVDPGVLEQLWVETRALSAPVTAGPEGKQPDGKRPTRRRRALPVTLVVVVAAGLVLSGVLYLGLSYEFRSIPGARSVHSAISAFRGGRATTGRSLKYPPPVQGVYELNGQGSEHISFPPNSQHDGSVMPASVTYLPGGCWRWHLDYNVAHWEEYDFCPSATSLTQLANRNSQSWDFGTLSITNVATFSCPASAVVLPDSPDAGNGTAWTCEGTSTAVQGKTTAQVAMRVVGSTFVVVGKHQEVPAVDEVQTTTLSGAQRGTVVESWWFSAANGLPVRVDRQIRIATASPLGDITYTEGGSWRMTSLTPHT